MIQVRRSRYRGQDGWLVCGRPPGVPKGHWGVSIFCEQESAARRIADKVRRGEEVTLADYD